MYPEREKKNYCVCVQWACIFSGCVYYIFSICCVCERESEMCVRTHMFESHLQLLLICVCVHAVYVRVHDTGTIVQPVCLCAVQYEKSCQRY